MWLTLTDEQGIVLERWFIPEAQITHKGVISRVENELPVYASKEEYEEVLRADIGLPRGGRRGFGSAGPFTGRRPAPAPAAVRHPDGGSGSLPTTEGHPPWCQHLPGGASTSAYRVIHGRGFAARSWTSRSSASRRLSRP
jgi:hypothetical protein